MLDGCDVVKLFKLISQQHLCVQGQASLAAVVARMESQSSTGGDILELNVGGRHMSTTRETLTQVQQIVAHIVNIFAG